jgi:predicted nucleic acid-binding protein
VLRVTADANVIISGLKFSGNPRRILNLAEAGVIHLAVSDAILDEVASVLKRLWIGTLPRRSSFWRGQVPEMCVTLIKIRWFL